MDVGGTAVDVGGAGVKVAVGGAGVLVGPDAVGELAGTGVFDGACVGAGVAVARGPVMLLSLPQWLPVRNTTATKIPRIPQSFRAIRLPNPAG